jgi:hypothetical protein
MRAQELIDEEYESVCDYMASCGRDGRLGDHLPMGISRECHELINADIYAFQQRIRDWAYMYAMEKIAV